VIPRGDELIDTTPLDAGGIFDGVHLEGLGTKPYQMHAKDLSVHGVFLRELGRNTADTDRLFKSEPGTLGF